MTNLPPIMPPTTFDRAPDSEAGVVSHGKSSGTVPLRATTRWDPCRGHLLELIEIFVVTEHFYRTSVA